VSDAVRVALEPKGTVIRPVITSFGPSAQRESGVTGSAMRPDASTASQISTPDRQTAEATAHQVNLLSVPPGQHRENAMPEPTQTTEIHTAEGAWRIVGVIGQLYVLLESPEGLVLMDQHAAHERVLFEKMLKELETDSAPSQKLLLPLTLELDARDAAFLQANEKTLHKLGIGVSEFGERTFLIDALPPYFPTANLAQTFRDIVDELRQTGEQVHARRLGEDKIATTVCRHAVKAHDPLRGEELRALLQQLHQCDLPYTCPHGRPTMIQISYAELEKKFGRKV
jgi:DNA mismatch repair protein MutL